MKMESEIQQQLDSLRFRLKTEQEFINDYGHNWRGIVMLWNSGMDRFFGLELDSADTLEIFKTWLGVQSTFILSEGQGHGYGFNSKSTVLI